MRKELPKLPKDIPAACCPICDNAIQFTGVIAEDEYEGLCLVHEDCLTDDEATNDK